MKNNNKLPSWIKLDNAATIYPSTLSRKYASMFRITITLKEKVDKNVLNKALKKVIKRFPSFNYELKQGLFWCYFKRIDDNLKIQDDFQNPMLRINFKENDGFMFRIRCFEKRIAIEYFHALTDGNGGTTFLLTLIAEYLKIKYGIKIKYNDIILNPKDKIDKEEYSDSFKKYARSFGGLEHELPAYHHKGKLVDNHILNIITGTIDIDILKERCHEYECTITQFIVSTIIFSIQILQEKEIKKQSKRKPIKVSIPIDLRKIYPSKTKRNFSSYINVGIEPKYGHYSFEDIVVQVKSNMNLLLDEKKLNAKITGNVKLANNYFIRLIPMFIKKHIMSITELMMGDRYCSTTFSNMGLIKIPKEMSYYVEEMGFIIGKSRGKPAACSCISIKNKLCISFSRKIKEAEFERLFFTKLIQMKIPVEIESNNRR